MRNRDSTWSLTVASPTIQAYARSAFASRSISRALPTPYEMA
jgi:hypothetical protein